MLHIKYVSQSDVVLSFIDNLISTDSRFSEVDREALFTNLNRLLNHVQTLEIRELTGTIKDLQSQVSKVREQRDDAQREIDLLRAELMTLRSSETLAGIITDTVKEHDILLMMLREPTLSKIKDAVRTVIFATKWEQEYG